MVDNIQNVKKWTILDIRFKAYAYVWFCIYFGFHLKEVFEGYEIFLLLEEQQWTVSFPIPSFKLRENTHALCGRPVAKKGFPKVNQQRIVDVFPWLLRFSLFHQNSKFHFT